MNTSDKAEMMTILNKILSNTQKEMLNHSDRMSIQTLHTLEAIRQQVTLEMAMVVIK